MGTRIDVVSNLWKISPNFRDYPVMREASMLSDETFAFQIVLRSEEGIGGQHLAVEGFQGVRLRREANVCGTLPGGPFHFDDYYLKEDLLPDILCDFGREGISAYPNKNTVVWAEVRGGEGIAPGKYHLSIVLRTDAGEETARTEFTLTVQKECLAESDLCVTHWFHYDCMADVCGAEPFTADYYRAMSPWIENYVAHGNNVILTPLFTPCLDTEVGTKRRVAQLIQVYKEGEGYRFGFEKLDEFIDFMQARGIKYFEMSHLFTQWGARCCPNIVIHDKDKTEEKFGWDVLSDDPSYRAFLSALLPKLTAFLEKKGIASRCFFHISDEPWEETIEAYKAHKEFFDQYLKGYTIMDALSSFEFSGLVDIPVVAVNHVAPFLEAKRKNWIYYCCGQTDDYVTNAFVAMPSLRTRMLGVQMFLNGAAGFLQWGYNFYNTTLSRAKVNPYIDQAGGGVFPAGDPFIVYPGKDGPVDSLRHELFFQAMQDYRLCLRAAQKVGREKVCELIRSFGWDGYKVYPHDEESFEKMRSQIFRLVAE